MKTAIALVLVLLAVGAVLLALRLFPAVSGGPVHPRPAASRPTSQSLLTPVQVVTAYVQALDRKDYRKAYDLLSADSRQLHPYDDFVARAEKGGSTDYELAKAAEEPGEGSSVVVAVPMTEDVSGAGFHLVREDGAWKVIFIGGTPGFPYADAGTSKVKSDAGDATRRGK
jgi:hypothetical protein